MIITAIIQQKRNVENVNIFLDEAYWISLSKNQLLQHQLHKGKEISEEEKASLEQASGNNKVMERVRKFIAIRPRSEKEVREYLLYKVGCDQECVSARARECENEGLIDDRRFSEWFARQRTEFGLHGDKKIEAELLKKGISASVINDTFESLRENDELRITREERLRKEIEKLKKTVKAKSEFELHQKIMRRLIGRGYAYNEIKHILDVASDGT